MRKNIVPGLLVCAVAMGLTGCGEKENKAQSFAIDFATKASKNQIDSLKLLYPSLDADSIALTFNADSISVVEGSDPNTFVINLGNGVTVNASGSEDGSISVSSSKGLYAFKADDLNFAKSTGMYDASLDDKALKARLSEIPAVKDYITQSYEASKKKDLAISSTVTGPGAGYASIRTLHIKVTNKGNVPVKGSDYNVNYGFSWMEFGESRSRKLSTPGKDVPVGGSVTINKEIIGMGGATGIAWKNKGVSFDFEKDFKPTGKEYKAYLDSRKDSAK